MPSFELTSPAYLILLAVYFITSSIKMFDIRTTQAKIGLMGSDMATVIQTEPPLPSWTVAIYWLDWLIAATLFILNWKITIVVWVIRFILKVLPVLETFGNVLMAPFRPKRPPGVGDEHLEIASAIIALSQTPTENKERWDANYKRMNQTAEQIEGNREDEKAIVASIGFLCGGNYAEYAGQDAAELCEQRRRDVEWRAQELRWESERIEQEKLDAKEPSEMDAYLRSLEDEI